MLLNKYNIFLLHKIKIVDKIRYLIVLLSIQRHPVINFYTRKWHLNKTLNWEASKPLNFRKKNILVRGCVYVKDKGRDLSGLSRVQWGALGRGKVRGQGMSEKRWEGLRSREHNEDAAAAKSLQSCPTLCDPMDGSPPGSSVPGILQAGVREWGAIAFSGLIKGHVFSLVERGAARCGGHNRRWTRSDLRFQWSLGQ